MGVQTKIYAYKERELKEYLEGWHAYISSLIPIAEVRNYLFPGLDDLSQLKLFLLTTCNDLDDSDCKITIRDVVLARLRLYKPNLPNIFKIIRDKEIIWTPAQMEMLITALKDGLLESHDDADLLFRHIMIQRGEKHKIASEPYVSLLRFETFKDNLGLPKEMSLEDFANALESQSFTKVKYRLIRSPAVDHNVTVIFEGGIRDLICFSYKSYLVACNRKVIFMFRQEEGDSVIYTFFIAFKTPKRENYIINENVEGVVEGLKRNGKLSVVRFIDLIRKKPYTFLPAKIFLEEILKVRKHRRYSALVQVIEALREKKAKRVFNHYHGSGEIVIYNDELMPKTCYVDVETNRVVYCDEPTISIYTERGRYTYYYLPYETGAYFSE